MARVDTVLVVEHVIDYAHMEKENNEPHNFFNACSMVLKLSTGPFTRLDDGDHYVLQQKIIHLLEDLETYLTSNPIPPPSPSLIVALLGYVTQNPELLAGLSSLIGLLRPIIGVHSSAFDQHEHSDSVDMHRRAFRLLSDIYSPRSNIRRQQAVDVQELNELGLSLPTPASPARDRQPTPSPASASLATPSHVPARDLQIQSPASLEGSL